MVGSEVSLSSSNIFLLIIGKTDEEEATNPVVLSIVVVVVVVGGVGGGGMMMGMLEGGGGARGTSVAGCPTRLSDCGTGGATGTPKEAIEKESTGVILSGHLSIFKGSGRTSSVMWPSSGRLISLQMEERRTFSDDEEREDWINSA